MTRTASRRRVAVEKAEATKLRRDTIGSRIQKLRYQLGLTQDQIAEPTGRGHSAVAQWERDDCEPPILVIQEIAKVLKTTPQYLAFGITSEPQIVAPDPETLGYAIIPEIIYGDQVIEETEVSKWGLPINWLRSDAQIINPESAIVYKAEYDVGPYQFGDRVLIDRTATRVSPPGVFLHWDGIGPALSMITPIHGVGKPTVRVSGAGETYECEVNQLVVIGRVRALCRKA